jgi:hypothetical protein
VKDERSGLLTRTPAIENGSLCEPTKNSVRFLELEGAVCIHLLTEQC